MMAKICWAQIRGGKIWCEMDTFGKLGCVSRSSCSLTLPLWVNLDIQISSSIQFLMHLPSNKQKEHVESKRKLLKHVFVLTSGIKSKYPLFLMLFAYTSPKQQQDWCTQCLERIRMLPVVVGYLPAMFSGAFLKKWFIPSCSKKCSTTQGKKGAMQVQRTMHCLRGGKSQAVLCDVTAWKVSIFSKRRKIHNDTANMAI